MPSPNTISIDRLARLLGRPDSPSLIDVRTEEDFDADPRLVPGAVRRPWAEVPAWGPAFAGTGRSAVVICKKGLKLSQGAAAWLRHQGVPTDVLEGGMVAWQAAKLPSVPVERLPPRDGQGRTVWVTRSRPKIDRIACPWLIRRFVDPHAVFLYVAPSEVLDVAERFGATPFDVDHVDVHWSHRGARCTFDLMVEEFGLETGAVEAAGDDRAGRRYRPAGTRARIGRAAGGLARTVAHVRRRPRAARGGPRPLRRLLSMVSRRRRRRSRLAAGREEVVSAPQPHGVPFGEAMKVWARVAALSFGGPAGQIAVMHRIIVEEKKWIGEQRFLQALNYCTLLPGPEAQQLAIYIGWLMHKTRGGLLAGTLFVLPGLLAIMALSLDLRAARQGHDRAGPVLRPEGRRAGDRDRGGAAGRQARAAATTRCARWRRRPSSRSSSTTCRFR